ncbi:ectonucleotide pyrophosphatase/phosphodiesterase [Eubacteriales bacterium OttesenSCG-928-A19]|nr:ectonucleotide pyrophosphatase/phosphodiesterase [Eubacteriales bacterium OttesenSCG-928-A19]
MSKSKHVIVISQDAMIYEDTETLKTLPNFGKFWEKTARVDHARSVYPSLTYPAHVSMMTGVYPGRHGIVNNEYAIPGEKSSKWIHFREDVKAPTIFDYAKKAGLSTAAVFWPVTGNDPSIDYLVDEYWPQSPEETTRDCFANSGSSDEVMRKVVEPNLHMLINRIHPYCDAFIHACAGAIIREFKPNLLMIHPANIDAYRHQTGLFSPRVTQGLTEIDLWFGDIVKATQDAGIFEDTTFFIISDHGQMNIVRNIAPNVVFAENGLIDVDEAGRFTDYRAFCKSTGLSAQVYLKDPGNQEDYARTKALLDRMCQDEIYGISRVYTAEEAQKEEGLAGAFSFVLETDGFTSFANDWVRPLVRPMDISDYRFGRATHGYQPDKGPQPTMFAFGPGVRAGAVLPNCSIVDEPPTIARVLGLDMPGTDGKVLEELLA